MSDTMELGLSYDDVLLVPQKSPVESRSNIDTTTEIVPGVEVEYPLISSNMDTVTEKEMAQGIADVGGCGIVHRFMSMDEQVEHISSVDGVVGGCVGIDEDFVSNGKRLVEAGADFITVDVAHGHMTQCLEAVADLDEQLSVPIMAGNVATGQGAKDLIKAGADSIKVGVGPGAVCKTREVAGVGVPQFTAVKNVVNAVETMEQMGSQTQNVTVIADGGIKKSGDTIKALMAGADAVMCGSLFGACSEAPGEVVEADGTKYKTYRGMASEEAREDNPGSSDDSDEHRAVEGVEGLQEYAGPVSVVVREHMKGVRSGLSYCGGHSIEEAQEYAQFVRVTNSTINRNGSHGVLTD